MTDTENRPFDWFTPRRFGILLGLLIFASFPQVVLGFQTFVTRDYGFFAYPLAYFQRECFWQGQIPFWDPYNNCGVPFLAQWNTMPLYPPSLIYLLLPLTWGLGLFCLLHLWFGGLGMYFLARKWTGNNFASAFAGTAFCFSGLTLNLLMWPSHTATWSWMPWVILAVESAWREGGRKIYIAAIAGAFQMLAGGPEIIFFTWLLLLALWLQQVVMNEVPRKCFFRFPLIVLLVTMMAAAQLFPFLDLVNHSQRQAGYADFRWSMPGSGWINYLVPMAFGAIRGEGIFFQNNQSWTSSYYLGLGTLWLALLAIWKSRNRRIWLLLFIAALAVIFALGANTPIFPAIRRLFPQFGFVTYPVKYLLLVTFIAPLFAAFYLSRPLEKTTRRQILTVGMVLLGFLGAALFWACKFPFPTDNVHATGLNGLSRTLFLILTGAVLLALTHKPELKIAKFFPLLLILVAWLDILTHEPRQNPTVPRTVYELNLAREKLVMNPQPELGSSRVMVTPAAFMDFIHMGLRDPMNNYLAKRLGYCANANILDAVPKVDGFFSLTPRENNNLFSLMYGTTNDFPCLDEFLGVSEMTATDQIYNWQPRKKFLPLVTVGQKPIFLSDEDTIQALAGTNFDGGRIVFLPPEAKQLVTATNQTEAHIVNSRVETQKVEIEILSPTPSVVVVAQTFYHDWSASVDGRNVPLLRANFAFQAVQVPPGRHSIQLVYRDRAFEIGATLSFLALLGCLLGSFASPQTRPPANKNQ